MVIFKLEEIWKDIDGYEMYQVSNRGRIFSRYSDKVLKSNIRGDGYAEVTLIDCKKRKNHNIHVLVAKYFIENPENKPYVNHLNGIKHDNDVSNLEWVTPQENTRHAFDTGLMKSGEEHPFYNKKHSDKSKDLMRKAKLGKTGFESNKGISVDCYLTKDDSLYMSFGSARQASIATGISESAIRYSASKKYRPKGEYYFIYTNK